MATHNINSILGGISSTYFAGQEGSFVGSCAIDPEKKINNRISGSINPVAYEQLEALKDVLWAVPNDVNSDIYYYTKDGKFGKISSSFTTTQISALSNASGNGLDYYNNYYYIATDTDVHRYGPINGTPTLEENWWTGLRESENITLLGQGDTLKLGLPAAGGVKKIMQSIYSSGRVGSVKMGLLNTGTNTTWNLKVTLREVKTETKESGFTNLSYDVDEPDTILAEKIIAVSTLPTSSMEMFEIEFDDIIEIETSGAAIVLEPENDFTSTDQHIDVMVSEHGSVSSGMLSFMEDSDWDTNPEERWTTDTASGTATDDIAKTFTVTTKETGAEVSGDMLLNFRASKESGTEDWFLQIRHNGTNIPSEHISPANFAEGSGTSTTTHTFTIKKSLGVKDGDTISIYVSAIASDDSPRSMTINNRLTNYAYLEWKDKTNPIEMGLILEVETLVFPDLKDDNYITVGSYNIPNHSMHTHLNGFLYFTDGKHINQINTSDGIKILSNDEFVPGDMIVGQTSGAVAEISTVEKNLGVTSAYIIATLEGVIGEFQDAETVKVLGKDTEGVIDGTVIKGSHNRLSDFNRLRLPDGYMAVGMAEIGMEVGIIAIKTKGTTNQGNAALFIWDTFDDVPRTMVELPYQIVTAIHSHNGVPYIWGGNNQGYSLSYYSGSSRIELLHHIDNGLPPLQGSVLGQQNRMLWGSSQVSPASRGSLWSWGYRSIRQGGLHNIATTAKQLSSIVINDLDGSILAFDGDGMHKEGGTAYNSIFQSEVLEFGQPFTIDKIIIGLSKELEEADEIDITLRYDNDSKQTSYEIRHNTYPDRMIVLEPASEGLQNLIIDIAIKCNASVILPIKIEYSLHT